MNADTPRDLPDKIEALAGRIEALPNNRDRLLIAIAGPPGSGKSTLAEAVVAELVARGHDAVMMPMDGFHLDNRLLQDRGLRARKGAPETFDFGGFHAALERVRKQPSVILPVFDRTRDIAIAGAVEIRAATRIVVVEGNYLCLDEEPWRRLGPLWDLSVYLDVPIDELKKRLVARWLAHGFGEQAAVEKAGSNDLPNAVRTSEAVIPVDLVMSSKA